MERRRRTTTVVDKPSEYEQLRLDNIGRNEQFLYGLGIEKLCSGSQKEQKQISDKKRKQNSTDQPQQPTRKSLRVTNDEVVLEPVHGNLVPLKPLRLQCKFCKIWSFVVPLPLAEAWLAKHLEDNATCIEIRKKEIGFEIDSHWHAKDQRFDTHKRSQEATNVLTLLVLQ